MEIVLQRQGLEIQQIQGQQMWPIKIVASLDAGATMPNPSIFVYHASNGDDLYEGDIFECVSSIQQYFELPVNTPFVGHGDREVPYYRSSTLQFNCLSPEEADYIWNVVLQDTNDLIRNFQSINNLSNMESVTLDGYNTPLDSASNFIPS